MMSLYKWYQKIYLYPLAIILFLIIWLAFGFHWIYEVSLTKLEKIAEGT